MTLREVLEKIGALLNNKDFEKWDEDTRDFFKYFVNGNRNCILLTSKFHNLLKSGIDMTMYDRMRKMGDESDYKFLKKHYEYVSMDEFSTMSFGDVIAPAYLEVNADECTVPRISDFLATIHVFSETYSTIEISFGGARSFMLKVMPGETEIDVNIPICCITFQSVFLKTLSGNVSKFRLDFLYLRTDIRDLLVRTHAIVNPLFQTSYDGGIGGSKYSQPIVFGFDNNGMLKYVDSHSSPYLIKKLIKHNRDYYPEQIESITSNYFFKPEYIGFYSKENRKLINNFYEIAKSEESLLYDLPMEILDLIMTEHTNIFNIFYSER